MKCIQQAISNKKINNQAYVTLTVYGDVHALGGMTQW